LNVVELAQPFCGVLRQCTAILLNRVDVFPIESFRRVYFLLEAFKKK
jgi:hypothetical protein